MLILQHLVKLLEIVLQLVNISLKITPELDIEILALQCHQLWRNEIVGKVYIFSSFTIIKFFRGETGEAKIWSNKNLFILLGLKEMIYFLQGVK